MILHWLVGEHPFVRRHPWGMLWLLVAFGWAVDAVLWLGTNQGWVQSTCWKPHHHDCNSSGTLLPTLAVILAVGMVATTVCMVWSAEERRIEKRKAAPAPEPEVVEGSMTPVRRPHAVPTALLRHMEDEIAVPIDTVVVRAEESAAQRWLAEHGPEDAPPRPAWPVEWCAEGGGHWSPLGTAHGH